MSDRFDTNTKGVAPALSEMLNEFSKMPRSTFDETRRKYFDAWPYAIIPVECFPMLPHSHAELSYDVSVLAKNPTIRRLMSGCTVELETYKISHMNDLWEGWNNFITTGRTGKVSKVIPRVDFSLGTSGAKTTLLPYSPYTYLNIVPSVFLGGTPSGESDPDHKADKWTIEYNSGLQTVPATGVQSPTCQVSGLTGLDGDSWFNSSALAVSALPGVMYCKIAKQFQNPNVLQDNKDWYPENENHDTILPYDVPSDIATCASYDNPGLAFDSTKHVLQPTNVTAYGASAGDNGSAPWLNVIYNKMRRGNYFNTGSPFPDLIRGDMPTEDVLTGSIDWSKVVLPDTPDQPFGTLLGASAQGLGFVPAANKRIVGLFSSSDSTASNRNAVGLADGSGISSLTKVGLTNSISDLAGSSNVKLEDILSKASIAGISLNIAKWRRLAALTVFRERMARTDGSYNAMIKAQFQWNPNWHEHDVIYCGGSTQPIVFSEVVQTSADNNASPLGTTGGRAVSAMQNKTIHIDSDDYSMFMTVLTITPDDVYSQGVERLWSELTQSEQYFPIMNNLEPQAILNKELYVSGTNSTDEDVFNYQERFSHFKSRRNQASGLMNLPIGKVGDTGAWIWNRIFGSTPQFNQEFLQGEFSDNENATFASTKQAQFVVTVASKLKYTAPIPSVTVPSDMGISY